MEFKIHGESSASFNLEDPQGSLMGQLLYIIASDNVAEDVP